MKRSRPRHGLRKCRPFWPPAQRIAHYSRLDPLSGCHIWQVGTDDGGYGILNFQGKVWRAHRLAWTAKHGPIPAGMILCHRCDERRCCNPDHLFLGTRPDNMADFKEKQQARADARATDSGGTIRIIYRGVELVGEVRVVAVDPRVELPPHSNGEVAPSYGAGGVMRRRQLRTSVEPLDPSARARRGHLPR